MMTPSSLSFAGGLFMGLASSVHCLGMCGGVVSALHLSAPPAHGSAMGKTAWARSLGLMQAGRVLSYSTMGGLVGGFGAAALGGLDHPTLYLLLRTAAALSLGWIGFTLTGLAPRVPVLERLFLMVSRFLQQVSGRGNGGTGGAMRRALLAGMAWGFMPCGMVYGALIFALATGSLLGGATVMAGFGLGTVPALTSLALGMGSLRRFAHHRQLQTVVGCAIMGFAALTVFLPMNAVAAFCLPR